MFTKVVIAKVLKLIENGLTKYLVNLLQGQYDTASTY